MSYHGAFFLSGSLYESLKNISEGEPEVITHKQGDPVVLISQSQFNELLNEREALKKMAIGLSQIKEGRGISHEKALLQLKSFSQKWK